MAGPMGGAILETAVVHEIIRALTHKGQEPQVYFWRTSTGTEVDVVVDTGIALVQSRSRYPPPRTATWPTVLRCFGKMLVHGRPGGMWCIPATSSCPWARMPWHGRMMQSLTPPTSAATQWLALL